MNKKELIDAIAEKANVSKKEAGEVLDATLDVTRRSRCRGRQGSADRFRYLRGSASAEGERGHKTPVPAEKETQDRCRRGSRLQGRCRFQRRCQQIILRQYTEGRALRFSLCFFVAI